MKAEYTIAVTGLNAIDSPGPGVGVIRALRDSQDFNVRIIGLSYESLEPGIYMQNLVDKTYQIPYPTAGSNQLKNRLEYIHQQENLKVIIPNFDAELYNFIKLTPELKELGISTFLPDLNDLERLDKMHLHEFGQKYGIKVPKTKFLVDVHDIKTIKDDFDYPVFVKGRFYEAFLAYNEEQVLTFYHRLNAKWGLPVIIQQSIKGNEIDVAGLADGNGHLLGAIPMRKLYITDKGKGWSGVVLGDDKLVELARDFVSHSRWRGGFELEYIRTESEEFYLLELNPRFPAWIYTTAAAGQNLPEALVKLALGHQVNPFQDYQVGKMFVRYSWDLITDIQKFHEISTKGEL